MRCLLDKVSARYAVQGFLMLAADNNLTSKEQITLDFLVRSSLSAYRLFIAPPTANVLQNLLKYPHYAPIIELFLDRVEKVEPSRYFKRWARRLQSFGFTREDAAILALASFGTDKYGAILGMEYVATFDKQLMNNWISRQTEIQKRFNAMRNKLSIPYCYVALPQVLPPDQIIS